jgi:pimeloyl-ACP methyl ester carboxylesterase
VRVALRDGSRIFFEVIGTKLVPEGPVMRERPTLLILHGGPGFDHSGLAHTFAPLSDFAQLVALDHRGQGRSDGDDPAEWRLDRWVADIVEFCEALELERPMILGQSFGGVVGLAVAARHPELPSKLVVSSSLARFRPDRSFPMFERLGGPEVRAVAERHFAELSDESAQEFLRVALPVYNPTPMPADVIARTRLKLEVGNEWFREEGLAVDLLPELPSIRCPTLVLGGELDPITPPADSEDIAAAIPQAEVRIVEGAGHGVFRDRLEDAMAIIREFLGR